MTLIEAIGKIESGKHSIFLFKLIAERLDLL